MGSKKYKYSLKHLFIALFFIFTFLWVPLKIFFYFGNVRSASMYKTLLVGDIPVASKIFYCVKLPFLGKLCERNKIKRQEVVILKQNAEILVKRVIGLPGDRLQIDNNVVFINDKELLEPYKILLPNRSIKYMDEIEIPENKYFVMGDNRNFSIDSRYFGFIDKKDILGRVFMVLASWEPESNKFRKERFWKFISFPESK